MADAGEPDNEVSVDDDQKVKGGKKSVVGSACWLDNMNPPRSLAGSFSVTEHNHKERATPLILPPRFGGGGSADSAKRSIAAFDTHDRQESTSRGSSVVSLQLKPV